MFKIFNSAKKNVDDKAKKGQQSQDQLKSQDTKKPSDNKDVTSFITTGKDADVKPKGGIDQSKLAAFVANGNKIAEEKKRKD